MHPRKKTNADQAKFDKTSKNGVTEKTYSPTNNDPKDKNGISSSFSWNTPPPCIVDVGEFIKKENKYGHLLTPDSIIVNMPDRKTFEVRIVTLFVLDKGLSKLVKSSMDYVIKMLANLGVNILQIVKGKEFPVWEMSLPIPEDCIPLTRRDIGNKDCIIIVEYQGQRRMKESVFGQQVSAFHKQYGEFVEIHPDKLGNKSII